LRSYTLGGTWLTREERLKGSVEKGKLADLVVLDRDFFAVPDEQIRDIRPTLTIAGGRVVWEAGR
jgi:predicted amidohydrolase YtcJ